MKNELLQRSKYILWDVVAAIMAYSGLFAFRRLVIEKQVYADGDLELSLSFYLGLVLIPAFWITVYLITEFYKDIYRRSRLKELLYTFNASLLGSIFIFFALMLDDSVASYKDYYRGFIVYFSGHFVLTAFFRMLLSTRTAYRIRNGNISFNTLLIGSNEKAAELYHELSTSGHKIGNKFIGFASVHNNIKFLIEKNLPHLGSYKELGAIIAKESVEEIIIAIESSEHEKLETILNILEGHNVNVKMIPDTYDIISGKVRMESLGSTPLVEIKHQLMPLWQQVLKRVFDVLTSIFFLVVLSPLFLAIYLITKLSDKGPAFYWQKRVGLHGKEFNMLKFRSMTVNAEANGPQLSSENDSRITPWGRFMRKYRLDELPQFLNVLLGQMSIVGPRPERKYYMELISQKAPHYKHLHKVKPGITSWGMVKFGYAENVEQMI